MSSKQTVWRIRDWEVKFEVSQARRVRELSWFSMSNRMDSDDQTDILGHESGSAHFGAWVCLLQLASRCQPRGLLLRQNGTPHDVASLSRITRIPTPILDEVIPRLIEIGSLEEMELDAVQTLINEWKRAVKSPASLPKKLARVLTKLGVPEDCTITIRRQVMKSAEEFGGPARFAAGLEKAIEDDCTDLSTATAWVRKSTWRKADRKVVEGEQEPEIRCDND